MRKVLAPHALWLLTSKKSTTVMSNDEILSAMKFELFTVLDLMLEFLEGIDIHMSWIYNFEEPAMQSGKVSVYKWLRSRDPNFELTEELFIIACCGHTDLLRFILEKENVPKLKFPEDAYINAIKSESIECLQLLLDYDIGTRKNTILIKYKQVKIKTPGGKVISFHTSELYNSAISLKNMNVFNWLEEHIGNVEYKDCYNQALNIGFLDFIKQCNQKGLIEIKQTHFSRFAKNIELLNYYMEFGPVVPKDFDFGTDYFEEKSYETIVKLVEYGFTRPLNHPNEFLFAGNDEESLKIIKYLDSKGCKKMIECSAQAADFQNLKTLTWLKEHNYPWDFRVTKSACFGLQTRSIECLKYLRAIDEYEGLHEPCPWTWECYENALGWIDEIKNIFRPSNEMKHVLESSEERMQRLKEIKENKKDITKLLKFLYENGCPLDERCFQYLPRNKTYRKKVEEFLIDVKCPGWE